MSRKHKIAIAGLVILVTGLVVYLLTRKTGPAMEELAPEFQPTVTQK